MEPFLQGLDLSLEDPERSEWKDGRPLPGDVTTEQDWQELPLQFSSNWDDVVRQELTDKKMQSNTTLDVSI